jgi:surfeit locus 1 family protein
VSAEAAQAARGHWLVWTFVLLMLVLTGVFAALGFWQLNRLAEKEALIATVSSRIDLPPVDLPPSAEWVGFDPSIYEYRQVIATGEYAPEATVFVFTSLSDPRGQYAGPGYWIMTPLRLETGGSIFVNRGFVPQQMLAPEAAGDTAPVGTVTLTGVGRLSEEASSFTPGADYPKRTDWIRNVDRLASFVDASLGPFAPITIDLPAGAPGELPQGGETTLSFPNNHFGYALTWFGFAILTPILLAIWLLRQRRKPAKP